MYMYRYVYIHYVVDIPRFVTHPTNVSAAAPFSALFSCSVQAYGYLNITWYRRNRKLVPKKAYSILLPSANETKSILTIPNVTIEDVDVYCCLMWAGRITVKSLDANLFLAGTIYMYVYTKYITYS